jgi:putative transposase
LEKIGIASYPSNMRDSNGKFSKANYPGRATQDGDDEHFNEPLRNETLEANIFVSLEEVRDLARDWLTSYYEERLYDAHRNMPPTLFRQHLSNQDQQPSNT